MGGHLQKIDFWGVHLGEFSGSGTPKLCQIICLSKFYDIKKIYCSGLNHSKIDFGGPFGSVSGAWYPQIMSKYLSLKYNR